MNDLVDLAPRWARTPCYSRVYTSSPALRASYRFAPCAFDRSVLFPAQPAIRNAESDHRRSTVVFRQLLERPWYALGTAGVVVDVEAQCGNSLPCCRFRWVLFH
jgi:hypothetical protein